MIGLFGMLILTSGIAARGEAYPPRLDVSHAEAALPLPTDGGCLAAGDDGLQLRSALWRNLHHLLYAQATGSYPSARGRIPLAPEDTGATLSPEEWAVWKDAIAVYVPFARRDLLFDDAMVRIGRELSHADDNLTGSALPAELRRALVSARPIYERRFWDRHRRINDDWCSALQPRLASHFRPALERLQEIYGTEAPTLAPIEVTVYANWAGAYTSLSPAEIVISSGLPANGGDAALEIVLHEVSHTMVGPLLSTLDDAVRRHAGAPGSPPVSRDLWHQVLFYVAGEVVSRLLPDYVPYADRNGLWIRVWPGPVRDLLEKRLTPVIDGDLPIGTALDQLVSDLVQNSDADAGRARLFALPASNAHPDQGDGSEAR